jgi:FkbM family methyltransferase
MPGCCSIVPWVWLAVYVLVLPLQRAGAQDMLRRVQMNTGFIANAIVDVGANVGDWTREVRGIFPSSKALMVEATPMHDGTLQNVANQIGNAEHKIAVLSSKDNETVHFYQTGDTGNSMFRENSEHFKDATSVERKTITLDSLIAESFLRDEVIDILKADVQGAELAVFQGATKVLSQASFVHFEASTTQYNEGAPCFHEVDAFLRSQGFFFYDISGMHYNPAFKTFGLGQYDGMKFSGSFRLAQFLKPHSSSSCFSAIHSTGFTKASRGGT